MALLRASYHLLRTAHHAPRTTRYSPLTTPGAVRLRARLRAAATRGVQRERRLGGGVSGLPGLGPRGGASLPIDRCAIAHIRLQPPTHTVTACITYCYWQVLAKQGKEWAKPEAGDVGAGRSRAKERSGEGKERKGAAEPWPEE